MRQDAAFFGDAELDLIYIARRLNDALELEAALAAENIDYAVEADTYRGGFLFLSERTGAFFYVLPEIAQRAREFLIEKGFKPQPAAQ